MPMDRSKYCKDWEAISKQAREAAGQRCQECGVANGAVGARDRHGRWWDEGEIHGIPSDVGYALFDSRFPKMIRIVLTCHHPDHDRDNPTARLIVMCQRCHNRADARYRSKHAAETRRRRTLERTGQVEMAI